MGRIARRVLLLSGLALALGSGCMASPTLPMPPPGEPEIDGPTEEGTARLSGKVPEPRARVFAINWTQAELDDPLAFSGDWADHQGYYSFLIRAEIGDWCELWYEYEYGSKQSQSSHFQIPDPATR